MYVKMNTLPPSIKNFHSYNPNQLTLPSGTCSRNTTVTASLRFRKLIPEPTVAARTWEPITFLMGELDEFVPPETGKREGDS